LYVAAVNALKFGPGKNAHSERFLSVVL